MRKLQRWSWPLGVLWLSLGAAETQPKAHLGYADLHVHPAAHMSWGAVPNSHHPGSLERTGLFWGNPGLEASKACETMPHDLPACAPDTHWGSDADLVGHKMHNFEIGINDGITHAPHFEGGFPNFVGWPAADSLEHQQMHSAWLRRAWEGGLRLILADTGDNELLSKAFQTDGTLDVPLVHEKGYDLEVAMRQIAFIKRLAQANDSWMGIVDSPVEARATIEAGKLAVVLGVEMDELRPCDLETLWDAGVRHVIPIHLADNPSYGGSAVYGDLFNANTKFLTGDFMKVEGSPESSFHLSYCVQRTDPGFDAPNPGNLSRKEYCSLGYECCADNPSPDDCVYRDEDGHENKFGLYVDAGASENIKRLMSLGYLIDLAHMSRKSIDAVLTVGEGFGYPLFDSHTAVVAAGGVNGDAGSDRDLTTTEVHRIAQLGGVVGLGTGAEGAPKVLYAGGPALAHIRAGDPFNVSQPSALFTDYGLRRGVGAGASRAPHEELAKLSGGSFAFKNRGRAFEAGQFTVDGKVNGEWVEVFSGTVPKPITSVKPLSPDDEIRALRFSILTTKLPPGGLEAQVAVKLKNHTRTLDLNKGQSFAITDRPQERTVFLTHPVALKDIRQISIRTCLPAGILAIVGSFGWQIQSIQLVAERVGDEPGEGQLLAKTGDNVAPAMFDGVGTNELVVYRAPVRLDDQMLSARAIQFTATSGAIPLATDDGVCAFVSFPGNPPVSVNLSRGASFDATSTLTSSILLLPLGANMRDLQLIQIDSCTHSSKFDWQLAALQVTVFQDPTREWLGRYAMVNAAMGDKKGGVAIGSDLNGFAPQIFFALKDVRYPLLLAYDLRVPQAV